MLRFNQLQDLLSTSIVEGTAEVTWPPNLVTNGSILYPLLMFPYGGPQDFTQANMMWKHVASLYVGGWQTYLASSGKVQLIHSIMHYSMLSLFPKSIFDGLCCPYNVWSL